MSFSEIGGRRNVSNTVLVGILCELIDKYVLKTVFSAGKRKPKGMTSEVRNQIRDKEKAWKCLKARKTPRRAEEYRRLRNLTTSVIRKAKKAGTFLLLPHH